jgi:DTW domain-containing protein YfiP
MHRTLCICALIPRIATRTRLLLILHQLEDRKPTNTGRLAARCLINSAVSTRGGTPPAAAWQGTQPVLLFPHDEARPLESWRDSPQPITLVVPDGTWRQANKARRRIEGLAELPCAALPPVVRSSYRLRHDRRPDRVSTIEAIALSLRILEGPAVAEPLERIFRIMVDRTLWTNGRIASGEVTGGIPPGVRSHDPMGVPRGASGPGPASGDLLGDLDP